MMIRGVSSCIFDLVTCKLVLLVGLKKTTGLRHNGDKNNRNKTESLILAITPQPKRTQKLKYTKTQLHLNPCRLLKPH